MPDELPGDDSDDGVTIIKFTTLPSDSTGPDPSEPQRTGFPPVPDPLYLRLKDEIEGMGLVATSWLECIGQHTYTTQLREDIVAFQLQITVFVSWLENPNEAQETPHRIASAEEQFWQHLKDEYTELKDMVDTMRQPAAKRVRRNPSGDESPPLESQTIGSSSQRAPTSAPPPVSVEAEDTYVYQNTDDAVDDHHAQPQQGRGCG